MDDIQKKELIDFLKQYLSIHISAPTTHIEVEIYIGNETICSSMCEVDYVASYKY